MFKRKFKYIIFLGLILSLQSCISNKIMCLEDDDVYFIKGDEMGEHEWERYLESLEKQNSETDEEN